MPMLNSQVHTLGNNIQTPAGESILLKSPKEPKQSHIKPMYIQLCKNIQKECQFSTQKLSQPPDRNFDV